MSFAAPWMLLGLLVLPWLVWLERRRERPERVAVSSLLLYEGADGSGGRSAPFWRWWRVVLLASAWTAVVVAAAGPGIATSAAHGRRIGVILDRSASLRTQIADGDVRTRWSAASARVVAWLDALEGSDRVALRVVPGPDDVTDWLTPRAAREAIEAIEPSDAPGRPQAFDVARFTAEDGSASRARPIEVVVVTDDAREVEGAGGIVVAAGDRVENTAVRSVVVEVEDAGTGDDATPPDATGPVATGPLAVRRLIADVRHFGDRAREMTLVLEVDGTDVAQRRVRIESDGREWVAFDDVRVREYAAIRIAEPDALASDDRFVLARGTRGPLRIAVDADTPAPLVRAFRLDPRVEIVRGAARADVAVSTDERVLARVRVVIDPATDVAGITVGDPVRASRLVSSDVADGAGIALDGVRVETVRRLGVPSDATVLASAVLDDGESTPVIVRRDDVLVVAFSIERSDWWRQPSFPVFWHERVTRWIGDRPDPGLSSRATGDRITFGFAGTLAGADGSTETFRSDEDVTLVTARRYAVRSEDGGAVFSLAANLESDDESSGRVFAVSTPVDPDTGVPWSLRADSDEETGAGASRRTAARACVALGIVLLAFFYARYRD